MNKICRCIIEGITLSVEQADQVCSDLDQLDSTGVWNAPEWAAELAKCYRLHIAHITVQYFAWRAAAKAYQCRTIREETQEEYE